MTMMVEANAVSLSKDLARATIMWRVSGRCVDVSSGEALTTPVPRPEFSA